ncbi:uncharacterized protein [Physcomitrium patens]|uniref:Uncharacterized protein n=1 Tax=Physcomitrium patens TaxID=3218 RepID=A0A2K1JU08_PHYPA|nr:uncharacterized protein LOC112288745 [Physcomitrium patens]PNR45013.1 hypothetical protein PHYPA_014783 [Physcomitrium patens]|eukprot:XP_024389040.1 uncharacterized protein LOC112288745 [Physcomitrella patens]
MFPSKTNHIMSRYRPIAPKPTPKSEGTDQADSHSLSSLSADKSKSTGKRRGKRPPDTSKSPRTAKKARSHGTSSGSMTRKFGGADGNVEFQTPSFNLTPIFSDRVAPVFGPGGMQRFKESFDHPQGGVSVSLSLSAKSPPRDSYYEQTTNFNNLNCTTSRYGREGLSFNIGTSRPVTFEKDLRFMGRAADAREGYAEGNLASLFSADFPNTCGGREPFFRCPSHSTSFGADSEVCSAEHVAENQKSNIVTLSLLPDTPSCVNTRSTSSSSTLSLLRSDIRWSSGKEATTSSDLNTSLTMSSKGRWSEEDTNTSLRVSPPKRFASPVARMLLDRAVESSQGDGGMRVVDTHYLEQRHGGSSEAVMLTDEGERVLWVNSAFKRLSNERNSSSRTQAIGPHIDPLGIPTKLSVLTFQPPFPAPKCKAILWGFLKKFILPEGGTHGSSSISEVQAKVIAPQPVRAVGSTITVQTIVSFDRHSVPLTETFQDVQERLDKGDMPYVVTDLKFRVKWVNTAYKRLVGQPKLSWLASTVGSGADHEDSPASLRLAGDVSLVCDGAQIMDEIAAFTCRVGIHWSHQGEHSAMSVPSEVFRLEDGTAGSMYVWGFDVCDAGVKNVLQIEETSPFC